MTREGPAPRSRRRTRRGNRPCRVSRRPPRWRRAARPVVVASVVVLAVLLMPTDVVADVVRVVVDRREELADGRTWGEHGVYEKLVGRIFFEFDPADPANAAIVDLDRAPRNARGRVEAWADFMVLQPRDASRRRGIAWFEVSNRGGKASLRYFNGAEAGGSDPVTDEQLGDGLLMRQGLTVIWVGWQWDVPEGERGLLRLHAPTIPGDVEGLARADWAVDEPRDTLELGHRGHRAYPVAATDDPANVLSVRDGRLDERTVVPRESWSFVAGPEGHLSRVVVDGGFEAGRIYELVYRASDPRVVGVGLAAVRDVMSYAKYGLDTPFPVRRGVAFGVSQTGRFLRHFLYEGFNVDEAGRTVFDGMLVHTAGAGRGSFNHRFGQPSRDAHRYSAFFYPTDLFPFAGRTLRDPETGLEDGLMAATPEEHRPRVFYTNTGYEYWGRAASLIHTAPDGLGDAPPLADERVYHLAGAQHFVGGFPPSPERPAAEEGGPPILRGNPLDFFPTLRALAIRLLEWVEDGAEPPPSAYPTLAQGSLVPPGGVAFPSIPGLETPEVAHEAYRADYGPRFATEGVVTLQPPELGRAFPSMVGQVDGLGNELAGVRGIELRVPVATYLPWNLRGSSAPAAAGELTDFVGTFVPLPRTEEEREAWGDPRPSLEALYGTRAEYMRRVVAAVQDLTSGGVLLREDAGPVSVRAAQLWDWAMAPSVDGDGGGG